MLEVDIDDLDHRILEVVSRVNFWSADDVYAEITGFSNGRFGRTLICLKLAKLAEKGYLNMDSRMRKGEQKLVYSINKNSIISEVIK